MIIARSIFFRDKKNENHPPEPFKSSIPPHLEKQQQKALEEYKNNEDPSLKCYGKELLLLFFSIDIFICCLVNISEPVPSLDMYQTAKRGLQVLLWTDLLKGSISSLRLCFYISIGI